MLARQEAVDRRGDTLIHRCERLDSWNVAMLRQDFDIVDDYDTLASASEATERQRRLEVLVALEAEWHQDYGERRSAGVLRNLGGPRRESGAHYAAEAGYDYHGLRPLNLIGERDSVILCLRSKQGSTNWTNTPGFDHDGPRVGKRREVLCSAAHEDGVAKRL
jgi:hypothetical protein